MSRAPHSVWFLLVALGCGSPSEDDAEKTGGASSGGATVTGGTGGLGTGGLVTGGVSTGGIGGAPTTGGASGSGGTLPTGGTGGLVLTGGTGGATSGGAGTGGLVVTGGANTGGAVTTGGSDTGGVVTSGGSDTGGVLVSGGMGGSGAGAPPTGGAGEGGVAPQSGGDGGVGGEGTGGLQGTGGGGVGTIACGTVATPGEVITFNDDGGWCWYQDERAIVDAEADRLIIGSVAINGGRNGNVEATLYDLAGGGAPQRSTLGDLNPDDHNTAAISKVGQDRYVAVYTTHNDDCNSYYNIYQNGSWGSRQAFDWTGHGCPTPANRTVSYSNLWHMGDQLYNFVRSTETSPNLLVSDDGSSWSYAGRLTSTATVGYVAGYYKYWGNDVDRIDFVGTEAHPRDFDNSLYHGYVQGGKVYDSAGAQVDDNLLDGNAQDVTRYTKLFATGSRLGSATLTHLWNCDLMRYPDGTIALIFTGRANGNTDDPDKRFGYARFDGTEWKSTYLVNAGHKLYSSEQDYTGLGALHPNNPNTIYISTTTDPRDDSTTFAKHEIWRGTTCDEGQTFEWTAITQNSTQDNLRPVVPYWDSDRTVLLWMRGTYHSAQTYDTDIVGVILDGV